MINYDEKKMEQALGSDLFRKIIASILLAQAQIVRTTSLPVAGSFISFKSNKILWSLTGSNISKAGLKSFLSRKDLEQIKESAILSLKRGQKINGKDLRKLRIVSGRNQFIEIRLSSQKYSKHIPIIKGPTGSQKPSVAVIKELKENKKEIEIGNIVGPVKWSLNVLISIRLFFINLFKRR